MRLQVKGKNVEVSEAIRTYAEEKLGRLERQLADPTRVELELAVEKNPSIAANHVAEATIWTKGPVLRAKEASTDMRASIDLLTDKLERQVTRYREKRRRRNHRGQRIGARAERSDRPGRGARSADREDEAVHAQADDAGGGGPRAGAGRSRLLRLPERRDGARSTSSTAGETAATA